MRTAIGAVIGFAVAWRLQGRTVKRLKERLACYLICEALGPILDKWRTQGVNP